MHLRQLFSEKGLNTFDEVRDYLHQPPYYITTIDRGSDDLFALHYSAQTRTTRATPPEISSVIAECRGIILERSTLNIVCWPFDRFFNYNDENATEIDWTTSTVQVKEDGSIFKLYNYRDEWMIATNKIVDSRTLQVPTRDGSGVMNRSFYDLFMESEAHSPINWGSLHKDCTYIFELVHPDHPITLEHEQPGLIHIGTRNIKTGLECEVDIGVRKPEQLQFESLEACVAAANQLIAMDKDGRTVLTGEGFVVRDGQHRRVKIKSQHYVRKAHQLTKLGYFDGGQQDTDHFIKLVLDNEQSEVLGYVPEAEPVFAALERDFRELSTVVFQDLRRLVCCTTNTADDDLKSVVGSIPKREFFQLVKQSGESCMLLGSSCDWIVLKLFDLQLKAEGSLDVDSAYEIVMRAPSVRMARQALTAVGLVQKWREVGCLPVVTRWVDMQCRLVKLRNRVDNLSP